MHTHARHLHWLLGADHCGELEAVYAICGFLSTFNLVRQNKQTVSQVKRCEETRPRECSVMTLL